MSTNKLESALRKARVLDITIRKLPHGAVVASVNGSPEITFLRQQLTKEWRVYKAECWRSVDELNKAGVLRRELYQYCYGHTDYFATGELAANLDQ